MLVLELIFYSFKIKRVEVNRSREQSARGWKERDMQGGTLNSIIDVLSGQLRGRADRRVCVKYRANFLFHLSWEPFNSVLGFSDYNRNGYYHSFFYFYRGRIPWKGLFPPIRLALLFLKNIVKIIFSPTKCALLWF